MNKDSHSKIRAGQPYPAGRTGIPQPCLELRSAARSGRSPETDGAGQAAPGSRWPSQGRPASRHAVDEARHDEALTADGPR